MNIESTAQFAEAKLPNINFNPDFTLPGHEWATEGYTAHYDYKVEKVKPDYTDGHTGPADTYVHLTIHGAMFGAVWVNDRALYLMIGPEAYRDFEEEIRDHVLHHPDF